MVMEAADLLGGEWMDAAVTIWLGL